jgi:hypothetical protein
LYSSFTCGELPPSAGGHGRKTGEKQVVAILGKILAKDFARAE